MTHIKLNEESQTFEYPPVNLNNICNYNSSIEMLERDGYVDIDNDLILAFNNGSAKIENNNIVDISQTPEYIAQQIQKRKDLFYSNFIKTSKGCIRLKTAIGDFIAILPNYSIESMSTGKLTAGRILFYNEPTFLSDDEELVSYPSNEMTSAEYMALYMEIQAEYQKIFNKG